MIRGKSSIAVTQSRNQTSSIRWLVIIILAILIGGVAVGKLCLHFFSFGPIPAGQDAREKVPTIPQKWQFSGDGSVSAALALGDDNTIYAAGEDGFLYAINPSGDLKWKFNAGPMLSPPTLGADGTIFVTNRDQIIFAVNRTGTQQWTAGGGPYADKGMGSVAPAIDQNYLYTPWRGLLRAIRLTTGTFSWPAGYGFQHGGAVSVLPDGSVVYTGVGRMDVADSAGRIVSEYPVMNPPMSVDLITKTAGRIPAGNFWLDSAMAVGGDGTIYACAVDSRLVALTADGRMKWEFRTSTHTVNRASPVIASDKTIYFASGDGTLYAMRPDGTQKWAFEAGGGPIFATPMLAADGTIYLLSGSRLLAVSPGGKLLEQASVEGAVESSPTLAPDGTIYVSWRGGKIVAYSGSHGGLMDSAWPKFQADPSNSGRARRW